MNGKCMNVLVLMLCILSIMSSTLSLINLNKYKVCKGNIKVLNMKLEQVKAENVSLKNTIKDFDK